MRLLKNADIAMYQAKDSGRNNFKFFTERMHTELMDYHELERDIAEALRKQAFRLVFQPKVNLVTRRLQGLEALLRWDCPKRGNVSPSEFIPVAEESGHIVPARLLGAEQRVRDHQALGERRACRWCRCR